MNSETQKKVRVSIDCSHEERKLIRLLAVNKDKGISECLVDLAKAEFDRTNSIKDTESSNPNTASNQHVL